MRDYQEVIIRFVKIVERYPELYDPNHGTYRTRHAELAWDKIADSVRIELQEQCTVEEIKTKWKGIRSSFNRFKNKLKKMNAAAPCKKYYLYDSLKFLEPFTKPRTNPKELMAILKGQSIFEDSEDSDDDSTHDEFTSEMMDSYEVSVKSEQDDNEDIISTKDARGMHNSLDIPNEVEMINHTKIHEQNADILSNHSMAKDKARKRKCEDVVDVIDNEDLHFFKSILPDIKHFSVKEKRKMKLGILKMIDEIEDNRVQMNPVHEVSSSKTKR